MSEQSVVPTHESGRDLATIGDDTQQFVTIRIAGQLFGLPVLSVFDILGHQKIANIPLSPPEVAGSLNLRGKVVTAINVRARMGLESHEDIDACMHVVVEYNGTQYSLIVDEVGEVLNLSPSDYEKNPPTLDARWREMSCGIYRLPEDLMVVLDVDQLLTTVGAAARENPVKTGT